MIISEGALMGLAFIVFAAAVIAFDAMLEEDA
jgi:hypothetical protein